MSVPQLLDDAADDWWAWARPARRTAGAFAISGLLAEGWRGAAAARLRTRAGDRLPFAPERWHGDAAPEEVEALACVRGPVIDLACGPGRLVRHLLAVGVEALGVDAAPDAVAAAHRRGTPALLADIWDPLPGEGGWGSVLLFDGNIGIGAEPGALLSRCATLLAPGGAVVVEVGPRGTGTGPVEARIERGLWRSPWFPWAAVGTDELGPLAREAGLDLVGIDGGAGRRFARLARPGVRSSSP